MNEAAEKFTDALVQSYMTVAERSASAQEGAQLTQVFFDQTIKNLRAQAEENRQSSEQLAKQQGQADAAQTLTQESVGTYLDFLDSLFSYWQGGIQTAKRHGAQETEKATKGGKELESNDG